MVVVVVVVVTGTHGRVSSGTAVGVVVVVVVVVVVGGTVVLVVVVVESGTAVLVVESEPGGSEPALTGTPEMIRGATTSRVANAARAADEERRGVDIARSRRAHSVVAHRTTNYRPSPAMA